MSDRKSTWSAFTGEIRPLHPDPPKGNPKPLADLVNLVCFTTAEIDGLAKLSDLALSKDKANRHLLECSACRQKLQNRRQEVRRQK